MDKISAALEEAPLVHGDISGYLLHPGFIGMWRDPGDLNATALQVDKEQHVIGDQLTQRDTSNLEAMKIPNSTNY